jgi:hypothetical protein
MTHQWFEPPPVTGGAHDHVRLPTAAVDEPDGGVVAHRVDGGPGLAAKDCIEILVVVPSQDSLMESTLSIETAGTNPGQGPFLMTPSHRYF